MAAPTIVFDGVWKKFWRGERHDTLRDLVPHAARRLFRRTAEPRDLDEKEFWVLRNVSFDVRPGEAFGIIGPNGAGKSTSLKLLTRILKPTRGRCAARGRVGAVIEVTAGFHHDLTGRENVFMQGAIMGMKRTEIARRFDEIVDFAGIPDFIDTPVKRYSSGMSARLGFSIAAHLNPNALIIDEVLAVGDIAFQERCYQRMAAFKRDGVAIVFVSHNFAAIRQVCDRVGMLASGEMHLFDDVAAGISAYSSMALKAPPAPPGGASVALTDAGGRPATSVAAGDVVHVVADFGPTRHQDSLSASIRVRRVETGEIVYHTTSASLGITAVTPSTGMSMRVRWTLMAHMARGHYTFEVSLFETNRRQWVAAGISAALSVEEVETESGTVWLDAGCALEAIDVSRRFEQRIQPADERDGNRSVPDAVVSKTGS